MASPEPLPVILTAERVSAFLAARKVRMVCPMCSASDWTAMEDADNLGFLVYTQSPQGNQGGKTLPLIALICKNCHYVWWMARRPVEVWSQEQHDGNGK